MLPRHKHFTQTKTFSFQNRKRQSCLPSLDSFCCFLPLHTKTFSFWYRKRPSYLPSLACLPSFAWLLYLTNVCIYVGTEWLLPLTTLANKASQVSKAQTHQHIPTYSNKLQHIPSLQHTPAFQHILTHSNILQHLPHIPKYSDTLKIHKIRKSVTTNNQPTLQHTPTFQHIPTHSNTFQHFPHIPKYSNTFKHSQNSQV